MALVSAVVWGTAAPTASAAEPSAAPAAAERPAGGGAAAASAAPVDYVVEGGNVLAVQGTRRQPVAVEGPALSVHLDGTVLYVARGPRGITLFDVTDPWVPRRVRDIATTGAATGFHVSSSGQVWGETVTRGAVPLDDAVARPAVPEPSSAPAAAAAGPRRETAPQSLPKPPVNLPIRAAGPGRIEIGQGANHGVRVGNRFVILRTTLVDGEDTTGFAGEEFVTVAEVVAVKEDSALAEIGRTAIIDGSDYARRATSDVENSHAFPPRVPNVGEVSVVLRPLINVGSPLGIGILADLEASYWGHSYFAGVRVQPLGLGWTTDGTVVSTAALAEGGYDARALAVGVGVGLSWVNGDADHMLRGFGSSDSAESSGSPTVTQSQETHAAFTMSQLVRLGARDGVNLSLRNLLILHHDDVLNQGGFIYGGTMGRFAIPLDVRSDFFVEGGGGVMGYWFAGLGVSTWIVGNGSPGSWKLSVSAGAAGIFGSKRISTTYPAGNGNPSFTSTYDQTIDIAGPMVSLGLARRFSF